MTKDKYYEENPFFIGLCGYQGSGKDTAAQMIKDTWYPRVRLEKFAQPLLDVCQSMFGVSSSVFKSTELKNRTTISLKSAGTLTVRDLMQRLGSGFRGVYDDIFIDLLESRLTNILGAPSSPTIIVVSDVRHQNEATYISGKGILVRIERPGIEKEVVNIEHESEKHIKNLKEAYIIKNSGSVDELYLKVKNMVYDKVPYPCLSKPYVGYETISEESLAKFVTEGVFKKNDTGTNLVDIPDYVIDLER